MNECLRLLLVSTPIPMANYLNLVMSFCAPELTFRIAVSNFRVSALVYFLFSGLFGGSVCLSSYSSGILDIATRSFLFLYLTVYINLFNLLNVFGLPLIVLLI